jgi:hypothetical protein
MAYVKLSPQSLNNPVETFRHFRAFMCSQNGIADYSSSGAGWTLHDEVYAVRAPGNPSGDAVGNPSGTEQYPYFNDYFVMYSAGEDGNRQMYFKVTYVSGFINVQGYLYWNAATHAGVQLFGATSTWTNTLATNNVLQVYADLDQFLGIAKYGSVYYGVLGGWCPGSRYDTTVTTVGSSISSGSDVVVTFASVPAEWEEGGFLIMKDNANIEKVKIKTISGNDVTFYSIASSYASGAKFELENTVFISSGHFGATYYRQIGHDGASGTKNQAMGPWITQAPNVTSGQSIDGAYPCMEMYWSNVTSFVGPLKNIYIAPPGTFSSESTHTIGGTNYTYINIFSNFNALIKEP